MTSMMLPSQLISKWQKAGFIGDNFNPQEREAAAIYFENQADYLRKNFGKEEYSDQTRVLSTAFVLASRVIHNEERSFSLIPRLEDFDEKPTTVDPKLITIPDYEFCIDKYQGYLKLDKEIEFIYDISDQLFDKINCFLSMKRVYFHVPLIFNFDLVSKNLDISTKLSFSD